MQARDFLIHQEPVFTANWFVGANAWLEDWETPSNVMDSSAEAVIEAACHAND